MCHLYIDANIEYLISLITMLAARLFLDIYLLASSYFQGYVFANYWKVGSGMGSDKQIVFSAQ